MQDRAWRSFRTQEAYCSSIIIYFIPSIIANIMYLCICFKELCIKFLLLWIFSQEPSSSRRQNYAARVSTRPWCPISSTSWTALKDATSNWTPSSTIGSPWGSKNSKETTADSAHFLRLPSSYDSPGTFQHLAPRYLSNRSEGQQEHSTSQLARSAIRPFRHPKCPTLDLAWAGSHRR